MQVVSTSTHFFFKLYLNNAKYLFSTQISCGITDRAIHTSQRVLQSNNHLVIQFLAKYRLVLVVTPRKTVFKVKTNTRHLHNMVKQLSTEFEIYFRYFLSFFFSFFPVPPFTLL